MRQSTLAMRMATAGESRSAAGAGAARERRVGRPVRRSRAQGDELVLAVLREHADSLLRVARRHSLCPDDAQDAYQRALEIFLRHARTLEAADAHKWIHTVVKHEAIRVRAQRSRTVAGAEPDLDAEPAGRLPSADDQVASFDLLTRSAEALQQLKPQELRALWLKAQGHSYQEIAEINGWTYTKVNRCITEGRKAFLERFARIGSGEECRRWTPVLSAMADGEASARDLAGVRPHLRHCPACRAQLREMAEATRRVAALLPVSLVAGPADHGGLLARVHDALAHLHDRVAVGASNLQAGAEAALPTKLAAAAASAAAVGGGVAVEQAVTTPQRPPAPRVVSNAAASPAPAARARRIVVRDPAAVPAAASARAERKPPRRVLARRTARSEFGVSRSRAQQASASTAAREFAQTDSGETSATTASSEPAPAPAPSAATTSTSASRTAAAEFGG